MRRNDSHYDATTQRQRWQNKRTALVSARTHERETKRNLKAQYAGKKSRIMLSCEHCMAPGRALFGATHSALHDAGHYVWQRAMCAAATTTRACQRCGAHLLRQWRDNCGSGCGSCSWCWCECCSGCCCSAQPPYAAGDKTGLGLGMGIVMVQPLASDAMASEKFAKNNNFIIECNETGGGCDGCAAGVGAGAINYPMESSEMCDGQCSLCAAEVDGVYATAAAADGDGYIDGSVTGGATTTNALLRPMVESGTPVLSVGIPVEIKPTHATDSHNSSGGSNATTAAAATGAAATPTTAKTPATTPTVTATATPDKVPVAETMSATSALSVDRVSDVLGEQLRLSTPASADGEVPAAANEANKSPVELTSLSRAQSTKSLAASVAASPAEDAVSRDSFLVVEDVLGDSTTSSKGSLSSATVSPLKAYSVSAPVTAAPPDDDGEGDDAANGAADRSRSPTIAELKSLSRHNSIIAKSMESLYERRALSKPDSLDNTTESCSSACSQPPLSAMTLPATLAIPLKPQHTPLKQKAKTTHFLKRDRRRVSPVKQSIRMVQAELYPATLTRFERPREALQKTFDQLDAPNWEVIIVGLKSMVRLMRYHPEQLENQMHMVCIQLTRTVRNLRSQVARAACQAATELFTLKSKYMEQECDDLIGALLHRTADTNRFLRADATHALESMCDHLAPAKVLQLMTTKGAMHQNAVVRTTTAKMLNRLVERLGSERVFGMAREHRDKFFITGANLLLEGSLETRSYAKSLFRQLSDHPHYNRLLIEVIPARTYRNIEKTLKNIR